jgi:sortase A
MRALPAVLVVAGGLGLVEGAVTLLWKEPFSALSAAKTQQALGADLEALERANAAEAAEAARSRKKTVQYQQRRAVSLRDGLDVGEPVGRLRIDKLDLNKIVVNGADEEVSLKKGLGQQVETPLPGQKGAWTTGIAGHRTTYGAPFRDIDKLDRGDKIVYTLPYGRYIYEVEKTRIVDADYTKAFVPQGADKIVVYACYPMYSDAQRILVYGKLKKSEPRGGAREAAART